MTTLSRNFVLCGDCGNPLTSCKSKGRNGYHSYYLCHRKGCDSYGKSIRRDVIEGEFETLLTGMQPTEGIVATARKMLRIVWDYRQQSGAKLAGAVKQELTALDRGIEQLQDRIVDASSPTVISAYEKRIEGMEKQKLVLQENLSKKAEPVKPFHETFRTALTFLANPQKLWRSGEFEQKRMLLRMAFTDKLVYARNQGFRTVEKALSFSLLGQIANDNEGMVVSSGLSSNFSDSFLEEFQACNDLFEHPPIPMGKQYIWEPLTAAA